MVTDCEAEKPTTTAINQGNASEVLVYRVQGVNQLMMVFGDAVVNNKQASVPRLVNADLASRGVSTSRQLPRVTRSPVSLLLQKKRVNCHSSTKITFDFDAMNGQQQQANKLQRLESFACAPRK